MHLVRDGAELSAFVAAAEAAAVSSKDARSHASHGRFLQEEEEAATAKAAAASGASSASAEDAAAAVLAAKSCPTRASLAAAAGPREIVVAQLACLRAEGSAEAAGWGAETAALEV